jgi:VWFA-related protein
MKGYTATILALFCVSICAVGVEAQKMAAPRDLKRDSRDEEETVRVNATLIDVPVSVMDRNGRFIPNLQREDFHLLDNGNPQRIEHFAPVEKPFTVALLLDTSGSTRFRLKDIQEAAVGFVEHLRAGDRVLVVSFNDKVEVLAEATNNRDVLQQAIWRAGSGDGTHLYDAVDFVINRRLNTVRGRKAIVLFTDGIDNVSRIATRAGVVEKVEELDAPIYSLQYDTFVEEDTVVMSGSVPGVQTASVAATKRTRTYPPGFGAKDYALARSYLKDLSNATGGRYYHADSLPKIRETFALVAEELRSQYSLGYYPDPRPSSSGERRTIKVRVNGRNLVVRAKRSYVSRLPGERAQN